MKKGKSKVKIVGSSRAVPEIDLTFYPYGDQIRQFLVGKDISEIRKLISEGKLNYNKDESDGDDEVYDPDYSKF